MTDWLDEIDLDPDRTWLRMATRALGDRPWLVIDDRREAELALKAELTAAPGTGVFAARPGTGPAGAETLQLVTAELAAAGIDIGPAGPADRHPLELAGLAVQEDLCLLERGRAGWILVAASLCFPSRWRLADKIGRPLLDVHGPVVGYRDALADRVDRLLDRLDDRVVWRRNWFVHPDAALYQPDRPAGGDPVVSAARCLDELHLRSERQTLRRLPESGMVLFTIRIQQEPLAALVAAEWRREALERFLGEAAEEVRAHRGLGRQQRDELVSALARMR